MRDFVSCFSENAINVAASQQTHHHYSFSCSSSAAAAASSTLLAATAAPSSDSTPSVQNAVSSLYRITLSTHKKPFHLSVTWAADWLTISSGQSSTFKLNTSSGLFRKKKGCRSIEAAGGGPDSKFDVYWDLSSARYEAAGPEPLDGFYVVVLVDSEIVLILGDLADESTVLPKKLLRTAAPASAAKSSLISRQEHCSGSTLYSTKAQFCETGGQHDILIKCSGGDGGEKEGVKQRNHHPVLSVCIDKKVVIRVKRLQWNFRGNQTIFVDGLLVDLMWDVHDWFFNPAAATATAAVFMFRTRRGMDSRLWLEEKLAQKEEQLQQQEKQQQRLEFSLLIYACKSH
ncbi:unnamed protein product [Linum trigynum]|uniref:DUF868 family protein n=1 Tax=Linum trigynum TaxID=586398 RepID=A0AAV2D4E4_9ROSI